jgi:hypothetical protein
MGVAQELLGLAAFPWWSKQGTPLIVDAMQQDGQEPFLAGTTTSMLRSSSIRRAKSIAFAFNTSIA